MTVKQHIKTGDTVKVIAGANKGKTGKVVKVDPKSRKAFVEGLGVRDRHMAKSMINPQGGKKQVHLGIDLSNLKKEGK